MLRSIRCATALLGVLSGACEVSAQAADAAPPGVAAPVSGAAAWARLVGNTIVGRVAGDSFAEYFDPGGTVRYVDKDGASAGTWTVKADRVCFEFPEEDERSCDAFEVVGTSGTSTDEDGTAVHFEMQPGNSKGL